MKLRSRKDYRQARHERIRKNVRGTAECPRMAISVSNKHIYVQFIDDENGVTMAGVSTLGGDLKRNVATAKTVGAKAAEAAKEKGIANVVVDRGGYKFHGRVKAIVEAFRAAGVSTAHKEAK